MILLLAVAIGLAATYFRAKLKRRTIKHISLQWEWLVFVSVLPQILIFFIPGMGRYIPETVIPYIQIGSMVGLIVFTALNLKYSSFWLIGLGLLSNFLAIVTNHGWMPISPATLYTLHPEIPQSMWEIGQRLGNSKDRIMDISSTNLAILSDTFAVPTWISYKFAFSIGDVVLSIGIILLLLSLSNEEKE